MADDPPHLPPPQPPRPDVPPPQVDPATLPSLGQVLARLAGAGVCWFLAMIGLGMSAMAGCCEGADRDGLLTIVLWVGTAGGLGLWSLTIALRARWLSAFVPLGWLVAYLEVT